MFKNEWADCEKEVAEAAKELNIDITKRLSTNDKYILINKARQILNKKYRFATRPMPSSKK